MAWPRMEPGNTPTVYLLHLERSFGHASHYLGFSRSLRRRLAAHATGRGATFMQRVREAGIGWTVVRLWRPGSRDIEKQLKLNFKSPQLCPICSGRPELGLCDGCRERVARGIRLCRRCRALVGQMPRRFKPMLRPYPQRLRREAARQAALVAAQGQTVTVGSLAEIEAIARSRWDEWGEEDGDALPY